MYIERLPEEIKAKLKTLEQPKQWHPEVTVYNHIYLVEKEAEKYKDPIVSMCAVFHDLGKIDTIQSRGNRNVFYGHAFKAEKYIDQYNHLYEDLDVDWDIVKWVCLNHMKAHLLDQMRPFKRDQIINHEWYEYLVKFNECDNKGRGEMPDEA